MSDLMHLCIRSGEIISHREQDMREFLFQSVGDYIKSVNEDRAVAGTAGLLPSPQSLQMSQTNITSFIRRGEYGKPYFTGSFSHICFSVSHSGRYLAVLYADATQGDVGLDIEDTSVGRSGRARHADRLMKIAARFFTPEETAWVREDPVNRFFRIWTGKESYIKYTGRGLGQGLDTFSVLTPPKDVLIEQVKLPEKEVTDIVCSRCCSLRGGVKDVKLVVYD